MKVAAVGSIRPCHISGCGKEIVVNYAAPPSIWCYYGIHKYWEVLLCKYIVAHAVSVVGWPHMRMQRVVYHYIVLNDTVVALAQF